MKEGAHAENKRAEETLKSFLSSFLHLSSSSFLSYQRTFLRLKQKKGCQPYTSHIMEKQCGKEGREEAKEAKRPKKCVRAWLRKNIQPVRIFQYKMLSR
jgi:hypothetical protein